MEYLQRYELDALQNRCSTISMKSNVMSSSTSETDQLLIQVRVNQNLHNVLLLKTQGRLAHACDHVKTRFLLFQRLRSENAQLHDEVAKLTKRIEALKNEKQKLANSIEIEEEYLTNAFQKKIETIQREKIDIENALEQVRPTACVFLLPWFASPPYLFIGFSHLKEEEAITHRLQRKILEQSATITKLTHENEVSVTSFVLLRILIGRFVAPQTRIGTL